MHSTCTCTLPQKKKGSKNIDKKHLHSKMFSIRLQTDLGVFPDIKLHHSTTCHDHRLLTITAFATTVKITETNIGEGINVEKLY